MGDNNTQINHKALTLFALFGILVILFFLLIVVVVQTTLLWKVTKAAGRHSRDDDEEKILGSASRFSTGATLTGSLDERGKPRFG